MKSFPTLFRDAIKNSLLFADYLFWLVFDFSKFKKIDKTKIKKVIVIHKGAMGEILISTPILKSLNENLHCRITYLLGKGKEIIVKNNPYVHNIITLSGDYNLDLENIKEGNFDLAVILSPCSIKMSRICSKAGIKYKIGGFPAIKSGPCFGLNKRTFPLWKRHAIEKNLDIIGLIGIDEKDPKIEFYPTKDDEKKIKNFLKKNSIKKYVIIHPGFGGGKDLKYPSRYWPEERYAEVADYLIERKKINVLITGIENENKIAEKIITSSKHRGKIVNCCGKFSFNEIGSLVKRTKLIIEPGTSIEHLACAFNIPVVSLFGRNDVWEWYLYYNGGKQLFHNEVCTSCNLDECRKKTTECLGAINTKEVINEIEKLIK